MLQDFLSLIDIIAVAVGSVVFFGVTLYIKGTQNLQSAVLSSIVFSVVMLLMRVILKKTGLFF